LDLEIHFVKENEFLSQDSHSSKKFLHEIKVVMAKNYIDNLKEEVTKGILAVTNREYQEKKAVSASENDLRTVWWRWRGSNPRPHDCQSCALPTALHPHINFYKTLIAIDRYFCQGKISRCIKCYHMNGKPLPFTIRLPMYELSGSITHGRKTLGLAVLTQLTIDVSLQCQ
jgi:hypothetical protein